MQRAIELKGRDPHPFELAHFQKEPEIDEAMLMCLQAWDDLQSCRPLGFGIAGYIPFDSLVAWADREGCDDELFMMLKHVIRRLDRDRAESEARKTSSKGKARR
jgi:hypothetical protein